MTSSLVSICELPDLTDGVVRLRAFAEADAAALAQIWRDPVIRSRNSVPEPSVEAALQWVAARRAGAAAGEAWEWAVVACETDELVGRRGMKVIDRDFARAAAACWIAPQFRGRRYAARSLHLAAEYVFTQGVIRVQGVCEADNTASFRHMTAANMTYEGTLRSYFVSNAGAIVDGAMFSFVPADLPAVLPGRVIAVHASRTHAFSKQPRASIQLVAGVGVEADAHAGATVQHRSRVAADPTQPNLRQVHLMQAELHDELVGAGFDVSPGVLGENITTRGLPLLSLPVGAMLKIGEALVAVTGLRNPCLQLDEYATGLLKAVAYVDADGVLVRKAGIMGVVVYGGTVAPGMPIVVTLPAPPHQALDRV